MTVSESQKRAEQKYKKEKYTSISLTMKPELKSKIQAAAQNAGVPTNTFIKIAVLEKIERDTNQS